MDACIECAGKAGYMQLNVVAENTSATSMYQSSEGEEDRWKVMWEYR